MTPASNRLRPYRLRLLSLLAAGLAVGTLPVNAQSYLQPSDQGESVSQLQQDLARLGYYNAAVTGSFDAATQAAVIQFQQANGLAADGIVGAATQAALSGTAQATAAGSTGDGQVVALQQQLTQLGYYEGPATGVFDSETQAAVLSFQRDRGLTMDGIVGSETETALYQTSAQAAPAATTYSANPAANTSADRSATTTSSLLQLGDSGAAVSDLQSRLQVLGYYDGPISGSFGPQTQVALTAFQQSQGLTADGIAGPQVNAALASAVMPVAQPVAQPVAPAVLPATLPQTAIAPAIPSIPTVAPAAPILPAAPPMLPPASVQVPGLPPAMPDAAMPDAAMPSQMQSSPANRSGSGGRMSVTELQRRLQVNGFTPAEITGEYDAATQSAVQQAQQSYGLSGQDFGN